MNTRTTPSAERQPALLPQSSDRPLPSSVLACEPAASQAGPFGTPAVRVLISTWPAHGHLLPLLPLARAAQRAGDEVVVASGAEGVAEARRRGLATWDVGPSRAEADATFRAAVPDMGAVPADRRMATVIAGVFGAAAQRRAADLVPLAKEWKPDLIVHPITELAGAVAAAQVGARQVVHGLGPLPAHAWTWFGAIRRAV